MFNNVSCFRLTSAHIRQFVSPDFRQRMFNFNVPSIAFNSQLKLKRKRSSDVDEIFLKKNIQGNSKVSFGKEERKKLIKGKKKSKKDALERICHPTLSFMLRTQKKVRMCHNLISS